MQRRGNKVDEAARERGRADTDVADSAPPTERTRLRNATEVDPEFQLAQTLGGEPSDGEQRTLTPQLSAGDTGALSISEYALEPGTYLGEYRIEHKVAEGAMGTVFEGLQPTIGKRVAIKVLKRQLCADPTSIERFVDEARAANQIGHPNIVDIFAFGEMPDQRRYLVLEWLGGETLRDRLRRGAMSLGQMAYVIRNLARALDAAHQKGIVHRDVKPENVIMVDTGEEQPLVKLVDFGIAKLAYKADAASGEAEILGTPMYIAPEQARNAEDVGWHTDIYSLGCVAFECVTGRPPFQAASIVEMVTKHLAEDPARPSSIDPEIPEEIDQLILGMLAKEPIDRPTLGHVRSVLERVRDPADLVVARTITVRSATPPAGVSARRAGSEPTRPPIAIRFTTGRPTRMTATVPTEGGTAMQAPSQPRWPWIAIAIVALALAVVIILRS